MCLLHYQRTWSKSEGVIGANSMLVKVFPTDMSPMVLGVVRAVCVAGARAWLPHFSAAVVCCNARSPLFGSNWGSREGPENAHLGASRKQKEVLGGPSEVPKVALEGPSEILKLLRTIGFLCILNP